MLAIQTNHGDLFAMAGIVAQFNATPMSVGLFTGRTSLSETAELDDLTEVGWTGYARQSPGVWADPEVASNKARTRSDFMTFENSSAEVQGVTGWFITIFVGETETLIAYGYFDSDLDVNVDADDGELSMRLKYSQDFEHDPA